MVERRSLLRLIFWPSVVKGSPFSVDHCNLFLGRLWVIACVFTRSHWWFLLSADWPSWWALNVANCFNRFPQTVILFCRRYLSEHLPAPSVIPVRVTFSVPSRKFTARQVQLAPTDKYEYVISFYEYVIAAVSLIASMLNTMQTLRLHFGFADVSLNCRNRCAQMSHITCLFFYFFFTVLNSLDDIRDRFRRLLEEAGHAVVEFDPECRFLLIGYVSGVTLLSNIFPFSIYICSQECAVGHDYANTACCGGRNVRTNM